MIRKFFKKIRSRSAKFRILETQGVFIPQYYTFAWEGIDVETDCHWYGDSAQINRCSFKTFDEANERLQRYLVSLEEKNRKEKQIIHIVEKDPSFWTILKNGDNKK